ncbi:hypothetical protein [Streptomyces syringium]|uniref:hypothetical protein n=1 Tax=Streptomyces syringium TaxID=76729 RepID=UPI003451182A
MHTAVGGGTAGEVRVLVNDQVWGPTVRAGESFDHTGFTGAGTEPGTVVKIGVEARRTSGNGSVYAAAQVGAVPTTAAGTAGGVATLGADGRVPASQLPPSSGAVQSVNDRTGVVVLGAADVGAAPAAHTHTAAQVGAVATTARGTANGVASLGADGRVPAAQLPAAALSLPGGWVPDDFGLRSWAYDLSASSRTPGDIPSEAGRLYLVGVPLRAAATITKVAIHVMGYDKPNTAVTAAHFGIYDQGLRRVAATTNAVASIPETHNTGGQIATSRSPRP